MDVRPIGLHTSQVGNRVFLSSETSIMAPKSIAVKKTALRSRGFWIFNRTVNPFVRMILRSPFHSMLDGGLILITYTGTRSGKRYTLPVQYARRGERLIVVPGRHEKKAWWRNLRVESGVRILYRGRWLDCSALAIEDGEGPASLLATYFKRFPKAARRRGIVPTIGQELPSEVVREAARKTVAVSIWPVRGPLGR